MEADHPEGGEWVGEMLRDAQSVGFEAFAPVREGMGNLIQVAVTIYRALTEELGFDHPQAMGALGSMLVGVVLHVEGERRATDEGS